MDNENNEENSVESLMIDSIQFPGIGEVAVDILDLGINDFCDNELVKKIPVLGMLVSAGKGISQIRENLFARKITLFLNGIGQIDPKEREDFFRNNCAGKDERKKLGRKTLEVLDSIDDSDKADFIGYIFKVYMKLKISWYERDLLFKAVRSTSLDSICFLLEFNTSWTTYNRSPDSQGYMVEELKIAGLLDEREAPEGDWDDGGKQVTLTSLGELINSLNYFQQENYKSLLERLNENHIEHKVENVFKYRKDLL